MRTRLSVGVMTGTSIDALDAALVGVTGEGLACRAVVESCLSRPLGDLAPRLRALAEQRPTTAGEIAALARDFALLHADACKELLAGRTPDLVCVHGQTIFHQPPVSWQLFQPAPLAHALRCPVVCDLRQADLAAGGQGAPITPIADWILFRRDEPTAVVNLGGFCNVTLLPPAVGTPDQIRARDVCACNQLLDALSRALLRAPYDDGGKAAAAGSPHEDALEDLIGVLKVQSAGRRSLGTGDEAADWLSRWRAHVAPNDLAATACEALAEVIAESIAGSDSALIAGGGVKNAALVARLRSAGPPAQTTDAAGVPAAYREAAAFAILGCLAQDRVPITLPQVTRCHTSLNTPAPIAGLWTL